MRTVGKYEIMDELGRGSMGTVYRAHDTVIDRDIALKMISTGIETDPQMRERFYREARSCGRLQHPNIVTIYDLGEEAKTAYIAMELLEGVDFRKVIADKLDLPVTQKLEMMAHICDALGHAHNHGVIHRDVKPSNIFLTDAGSVKVLDFGIARLTSSRLTVAGMILGTPNYMAPEQILGNPCDGRADLFSAGVVFFELLVYRHPFEGDKIPDRIISKEPDSLFDHQSNLPPILDKVFARALARKPEDRYSNAAVFAADLRAVLDTIRQSASGPNPVELPSDGVAKPEPILLDRNLFNMEPAIPPEGEDAAEWRNSEVLTLIPQFEKAIEQRDKPAAKKLFESLLQVSYADGRFTEAISSCRARLEQLETKASDETQFVNPAVARAATVGSMGSSSGTPKTQRICTECGAENRSAARFCIGCGANLNEPVPQVPSGETTPDPAKMAPETNFDRTTLYEPEKDAGPANDAGTANKDPGTPNLDTLQQVRTMAGPGLPWFRAYGKLIGSMVAALIVAVIIWALWRRPIPQQKLVATAKVAVPMMEVHVAGNASSKIVYSLTRGTKVHVLQIPESTSNEWVSVQFVQNDDARAPGFARRKELIEMEGRDAASSYAILKLTFESENTDSERRSKLEALKAFASSHPGSPEAKDAQAESDRLETILAPKPLLRDWTPEITQARQLFTATKYSDAEKKVLEIGPPENIEPQQLLQAQQLLKDIRQARNGSRVYRARKLLDDADLDGAERLVRKVLEEEPENEEAKSVLRKIELLRR